MADYRLTLRRDTAANWTSADPVLAQGEPGFETDTNRLKIGDGSTAWSSLPYYSADISGSIDDLSDVDTSSVAPVGGQALVWDGVAGQWEPGTISGYTDADVDTHLNTASAASGEYLSWNGSDYDWAAVPPGYSDSDVDTHLNSGTASNGDVLTWDGTDYTWAAPSSNIDGGAPSSTYLASQNISGGAP